MAGSIEKRGKNSYRLVCTGGYDLKGKLAKMDWDIGDMKL